MDSGIKGSEDRGLIMYQSGCTLVQLPRGLKGELGVCLHHIRRVSSTMNHFLYNSAVRLQYEFILSRCFAHCSWKGNELWSFSFKSTNASWTRRGSRITSADEDLNNAFVRSEIERLLVRRYAHYLMYAHMKCLPSVILELIMEFL